MGWIESWRDPQGTVSWDINVPRSAAYEVSIIAQGTSSGGKVYLEVAGEKRSGDFNAKWTRASFGTLRLRAGRQRVTVSSTASQPIRNFFSVELVRAATRRNLANRARKLRADTQWLVDDTYGLMFHWTSETKPRSGPPKPYQQAVRDFDVERFSQMVEETGAGHVVFTTSHAGFYFPGPNRTIDSILPGRTSERDLIAELIAALNKRGIRFIMYYHPGHDDEAWWSRTHFNESKPGFFRQWSAIIDEIGQRYGKGLAAFWFDDAMFTYYPFNAPWEQMTRAAKAGNPDRLVIYNTWIFPRASGFYEVFAGEDHFSREVIEGNGYLPVGGSGTFTGGPQQGLQGHITARLDGDWGHFRLDTPIGPPFVSAERLIADLRDCIARRNVPTFGLEIYQDGSISPQSLELFKAVKKAIRPPTS